jgi:hypothetical protein
MVPVPDGMLGLELAELDALVELTVVDGNGRLGSRLLCVLALGRKMQNDDQQRAEEVIERYIPTLYASIIYTYSFLLATFLKTCSLIFLWGELCRTSVIDQVSTCNNKTPYHTKQKRPKRRDNNPNIVKFQNFKLRPSLKLSPRYHLKIRHAIEENTFCGIPEHSKAYTKVS